MGKISALAISLLLLGGCAISGRIDDAAQQGREFAAEVADDRLSTGIYLTCSATLTAIRRRFTTQEAMDAYLGFCLADADVSIGVE